MSPTIVLVRPADRQPLSSVPDAPVRVRDRDALAPMVAWLGACCQPVQSEAALVLPELPKSVRDRLTDEAVIAVRSLDPAAVERATALARQTAHERIALLLALHADTPGAVPVADWAARLTDAVLAVYRGALRHEDEVQR